MTYKEMDIKFIVPTDVEGYHLTGMLNIVLQDVGGYVCSETVVRDAQLISNETILLQGDACE